MEEIKFDGQGLVPAVAQDFSTGEVLMLAYMNREALERTLSTGRAHYYSRSRKRLWMKGETSGNFQFVKGVFYDCDGDTVLLLVDQKGPACHTGERTCFFRSLTRAPGRPPAGPWILNDLFRVLLERKSAPPETSYVASLYSKGLERVLEKIDEESGELLDAAREKGGKEIVHETADLWFHTMVLLASRGIQPEEVFSELKRRFGTSGHEEKRRRKNNKS